MNLAEAAVRVVGDWSGFRREVQTQGQAGGRSLGQSLKAGMIAAGAIAGAIAIPMARIGDAYKESVNNIRIGTGLIGADLQSVEDSFKSVASRVPDDVKVVSQVMADLQTRTGLMGEGLETLTEQVLDYSRLTGADPVTNTAELTRVFGDWSVATEDQSDTMDMLLRAQQATGVGASQLQRQLVAYGAPMRQLGFSLEDTTMLLGKFEKEGVNTELVMGSMRIALGKMARAGEAPVETLQRVMDQIKNTGDAGEANALALEMFGARAGPDMAAAIREGRFDIESLAATMAASTDTVAGLTAETETAGDKIKGFFNGVTTAIGPFAEGFAGIAPILGPLLYTLPLLGGAMGALAGGVMSVGGAIFGTLIPALVSLLVPFLPIIAIIAVVVAVLAGLFLAWENNLFGIRDIAATVWSAISGIIGGAVEGITGVIGSIADVAKAVWETVSGIFSAIGDAAGAVGDFIGSATGWIPSFDVGAWNVPEDQLAVVHKGEAVLRPEQAAAWRRGDGGGGGGPTIIVNNPRPEPASTSVRRELNKLAVYGTRA